MPNCWKLLARQRQIPQAIPPIIRVFFSCILDTVLLEVSDLPDALEAESEGEFLFCRIKNQWNQNDCSDKGTDGIKSKASYVFHSYALSHKSDTPDDRCEAGAWNF